MNERKSQPESGYERVDNLTRSALARCLAFLSLALLIMGPLIVAFVVVVGKADGQLPPSVDQWWREGHIHGPLHGGPETNPGITHLNSGFESALMFPIYAFCVGVVSCIVRQNKIAKVVLVLSMVFDLAILFFYITLAQ